MTRDQPIFSAISTYFGGLNDRRECVVLSHVRTSEAGGDSWGADIELKSSLAVAFACTHMNLREVPHGLVCMA